MTLLVFVGLAATISFIYLMKQLWLKTTGSNTNSRGLYIAGITLVVSLIVLMASGRMHWIPAAGALMLPLFARVVSLIRTASVISNLFGSFTNFRANNLMNDVKFGTQPKPNDTKTETKELAMQLDHVSGEISGRIKIEPYMNRSLASLSDTELINFCSIVKDPESQQLMKAYIERYHPNITVGQKDSDTEQTQNDITKSRAFEILGIEPGASRDEIIEAHRRLIQRLHPDRGGSDYIAAEINEAKRILLT